MTESTHGHHAGTTGTSYELELPSNPSTGYRWEIDREHSAGLARIAIDELPAAHGEPDAGRPPRVGAPVTQRWRVHFLGLGSARLVLVYRRAWETAPPAKRHVIDLTIR